MYLEEEGISISTENGIQQVYFTLFLILGDNLGIHSMMGFSTGFTTDYFCRFCRTHKEILKNEVQINKFELRNEQNYHLDSISLNHGITELCIWNVLPNFHASKNLSCDLMHDMLEGVLRYDMSFLINDLLKKKYFSVSHLNERIKYFKFFKADIGNGIHQIRLSQLKNNKLVMSSAEMLSLTVYFGVLIGDLVPENDPSWHFYSIILELLDILLSRSF